MSTKIYVGNLPFNVTDQELKEMFERFGDVEEATVIKNKFSGRSKGFGFVTFTDDAAAKKAMSEMNDKDVQGRQVKVTEAKPFDPDRPRPERERRSFGGGGGRDREHRPRRFD